MHLFPAFRDFRENFVMAAPDDFAFQFVTLKPARADGQITHFLIKHRHGDRIIFDEEAQPFFRFAQFVFDQLSFRDAGV